MKVLTLILSLTLAGSTGAAGGVAVTRLAAAIQGSQPSAALTEANKLSSQAVELYKAQKYKEALVAAKRALEIRESILPAGEKSVLEAMGNLAVIHLKLNNFKEAEGLYKRILETKEKSLGPESLEVAKVLDTLAGIHYGRGNQGQAESDLKKALAIREKAAGPASEEVASTLFKLAQMYQFHGDLKKAEELYERIVSSDKNVLPDSSAILVESVDAYACLLRKLKRPEEAKALEDRIEGRIRRQRPSAIESGVLNGKALKLPKPPYPVEARNGRISGVVVVRVMISEEGHVVHACAESGHRVFWHGCELAAYGAEFSPTIVDGKAVRVTGVITYNFIAL